MLSVLKRSAPAMRRLPLLTCSQMRQLQTGYVPGQPITVYDSMCEVYRDPKYLLDLKPWDLKDGRYKHYVELASLIATMPPLALCFIAAFCLVWYTLFDTDVIITRGNPHPFFVPTGKEGLLYHAPVLQWMWKLGHGSQTDERVVFNHAIAAAIKARKAADAERKKAAKAQ